MCNGKCENASSPGSCAPGESLAALVAEFDRSMAPEIQAAAAPLPEWYRPES